MVLVEETSVVPNLKCLQHRSALKADLNLSLSKMVDPDLQAESPSPLTR